MINFKLILPETFMLIMICVVLLVDLFVKQKQQALTYALTQLTLVVMVIMVIAQYQMPTMHDHYVMVVHDKLASLLKIAIGLTSIFVFLYSRDYMRQRDMGKGDAYLLGLFSILGMMVMVSGYNFLTLYLGLELMSLPIYALVAINRQSEQGIEAGIKYFVLGAIASGMLLYGLSMVYGATGSLQIATVAHTIATTPSAHLYILIFGVVFVVAGLAFKMGLVPFHMWLPDVYTGSPNAATLFIAVAPKIAVFGLVFRLLVEAMPGLFIQWHQLFVIIAVLSMFLGNVAAIAQTNLKRMFAYSAIAHGGYMLLGFVAGTPQGFAAALFYTLAYAIMSLGGFGIICLLAKKGFEAQNIDDLKGLNRRNPWLALMMLLLLFSMAGIPPTVGFFAKLGLLEALIGAHMTWLAVVTLVFAIIGSYYYLRVVKVIYFEQPTKSSRLTMAWDAKLAISVNGLAILFLGLVPSGLITLCRAVFHI